MNISKKWNKEEPKNHLIGNKLATEEPQMVNSGKMKRLLVL